MVQKAILHLDGDAFFVGVEVAKNPKLKGLPAVTGEERGIASALSYEAKALGITRGMPIFQIKRKFPQVVVLPGDYASYIRYSEKMFDIVRRYADDVEEYSIDECFADLTGLDKPLKMSYIEIAKKIKEEVFSELKITVSVGIAPTKVLAKVASKWQKPNGLTQIKLEDKEKFLKEVSIEKIWGIGPKTSEFLKQKRINNALDFIEKDVSWIKNNLSKPYEVIWRELNGESVVPIDPLPKTKYSSIQKTRTFNPATNDKVFLMSELSKHIEDACLKARHYRLFTKKVTIFLKTKDFKYHKLSLDLLSLSNTPEAIISMMGKSMDKLHKKGILYRTTGVILENLISKSDVQSDLFGKDEKVKKFELIYEQIDSLEEKFGKRAVYLASSHKSLKRKKIGTDSEDLDRDLLFL